MVQVGCCFAVTVNAAAGTVAVRAAARDLAATTGGGELGTFVCSGGEGDLPSAKGAPIRAMTTAAAMIKVRR